ncbi:hypothetical protein BO221_42280 [Archangium sp. Cb G35]|nr:hypothetical protein BO221_42280 [Archangium sp. Cb G35]
MVKAHLIKDRTPKYRKGTRYYLSAWADALQGRDLRKVEPRYLLATPAANALPLEHPPPSPLPFSRFPLLGETTSSNSLMLASEISVSLPCFRSRLSGPFNRSS